MKFNCNKFAFTLAEVLITLGIIGVVAVMTMPTIIQNQQKRSLEVATQKFYSLLSQAVKQYMADEGIEDLRDSPLEYEEYGARTEEQAKHSFEDFVKKYLKVAKVCEKGCFADSYKQHNGKFSPFIGSGENGYYVGKFLLVDGSVLDFEIFPDTPITIYIDVNGRKGPNRIGYDLWSMSIFYDGSIDEGELTPECRKDGKCLYSNSPKEARERRFDVCKSDDFYGGCFGHFLENNFKFDY